MAHNDQHHSSLNLPQEALGNSPVEATADIEEMQTDEPQQPSSEPPQYSEVVAGPSSASLERRTRALSLADPPLQTFPPVAPSHTEQGPVDEMPPLIALSDNEEGQSPQADASTSRAPNTRRARVEDEEDEDEQRESNRQRITSPGAGSDADADHHYHPDIHTHAQEREQQQQQQQQQQPEGAPPTFHHMAFTLDWFPISLNPAPGARPAGANAGLPPLQTAFGNFGFDPVPQTHDIPINPTGAAPAQPQQQQQQDHPNPQPQPHPDAPNGASPAFFDLMRHLRDTIGGIQFGPDGTPANLPPGVHIHTGPPIFPPFGPMMGGMDFQEPEDPVRAMKLLKGLEEVSPGLLKRMERVAQEDQEMPVCAVCFDSLLEPAVEDEAQSSPEHPADSESVPMDVDAESTASNDPAISSTASTSGSTVTSTSTETTTNTTPATPAVDTSLDDKVFVLPCAHAFHGSCLRPWFTRPHRTTCPTCRFDVDPESLTYVAPPPGAQMDRIRQLFARAQRARAAANANGGGNVNAAPAAAAAGTNTNADAAPPLPFPLDLPQLPQLVDPRLLDPDDEITIIPIERVPAGSNAPLGAAAAGNAPLPAANAQPAGNAQPNANANANATGAGGFPAGMPPIGIILDFSLVFPPGARPAPAAAAQTPAQQVPQPAGPQAQDQPAGSQPQQGTGGQGGQNALPPASQRILDRVVNMRGQNGVTPASQRIIEQVVRGILSALAGPLPPPPAPPVPSTLVNPATGAGTNDAPPAERANSPPAASAASPRAVSEPPMGSPPPPPPPFMSFGGGGPLPAFGASVPVNALGPLPSFNEFVQLVQGGDNATGQAGGRTGVPEPPQPQEQGPRQGEGQPSNEGEQGQAPPGYSDFLHNIQHMVSNTMHRILARPGAPQQNAPPQGIAPIPPHPPIAQQARPPQPPGPIPLHVPPPLAVPLPHAHHHHHHHHHPPRPAGPKREWTVPPPPGPTLRARVERKERELGLRCWDVSCGLGPTDEDPVPGVDARGVRQVYIKPLRSTTPAPHPTSNTDKEGEEERVCEHSFHPACLVSAERVAGWNGADQKKDLEREGEEREVQVSCPVCRAVGVISREDWDEGACALA